MACKGMSSVVMNLKGAQWFSTADLKLNAGCSVFLESRQVRSSKKLPSGRIMSQHILSYELGPCYVLSRELHAQVDCAFRGLWQ